MLYSSTRGNSPSVNFLEVLTSGVAPDGGLYLPEEIPLFNKDELKSYESLTYNQLALKLLHPYMDDFLEINELEKIIEDAYSTFRIENVVRINNQNKFGNILELFHGPTFAFKDVAMQLLAGLLNKASEKIDKKIVILGATSGDTGSAAIEACKRYSDLDIFIFFPNKKISEVQQRQMTTSGAKNVNTIALDGDFDDCQKYVKQLFLDQENFPGLRFVSINSINWTRIISQSVYFFYANYLLNNNYIASIPSGNFGHAYAGWLASKMGLDLQGIHIATNKNDILHRLISSGTYQKNETIKSLAPSMDISVASNFERLMVEILNHDRDVVYDLMKKFPGNSIDFNEFQKWKEVKNFFLSSSTTDDEIRQCIKKIVSEAHYFLDPHTATAIDGKSSLKVNQKEILTFATAHPAKFPEAFEGIHGFSENIPNSLKEIFQKEEKLINIKNNYQEVSDYISSTCSI